MKSRYWIKLYHEILDDPKMGRLSDRLHRRAIEMFLMAGKEGTNGLLPSLTDMAWTLRVDPESLEGELEELEAVDIVCQVQGAQWQVVQFANRQAPSTATERSQKFRERERDKQYYGEEQPSDEPETSGNEPQNAKGTIRSAEPDRDRDEKPEPDRDKESSATRAPPEMPPDPSELTVQQIKALELPDDQWPILAHRESKGKNRKSVIAYCSQMLNRPPPAILAFQEATGKYPRKPLWRGIIRVVGDDPSDVAFWRRVCFNWNACGYNPLGVQGMLDNYQRRTIPTTKKGTQPPTQSTPADFARSEYAKPADTPARAPTTEAERIWSEVVNILRHYPHLAEIRAIPGDAADGIMLSGNRYVVEPVKARLMEPVQDAVDAAAGRPLEIRWVGDTGEVR